MDIGRPRRGKKGYQSEQNYSEITDYDEFKSEMSEELDTNEIERLIVQEKERKRVALEGEEPIKIKE